MDSRSFNSTGYSKGTKKSAHKNYYKNASNAIMNNSYKKDKYKYKYNSYSQNSSVINGYFVSEKSYKEIIISRINRALCCILGFLVLVCLVSYYFVVDKEIELRKLSKETIALNLDNADMQNKLDNLESFSNVDFQVSKLNILQRAKKVIELSALDLPDVSYDKKGEKGGVNTYLGY